MMRTLVMAVTGTTFGDVQAFVELTPDVCTRLQRLRLRAQNLASDEAQFFALELFNDDCTYTREDMYAQYDASTLDPDPAFFESTRADSVVVGVEGVRWQTYDKHSDDLWQTAIVPWSDLEAHLCS